MAMALAPTFYNCRFYIERKPKALILVKNTIEFLKTREDGGNKRSESPMVARPVSLGRRDSANIPAPKIKQAVKLIDENAGFCDSISEFMTDNQDFLVIGGCGLQVREKGSFYMFPASSKQRSFYPLLRLLKFNTCLFSLRMWGKAP